MTAKFFASAAAWRAWLDKNHAKETELIVGFHKAATGKPTMTWSESVDEAICYGWIDAVRRSLGDEAYSIRFTRRKPTSIWSAINVDKVEKLRAAGKMRPAGEAAFAKRTAAKTGVYSHERLAAAVLTPEEEAQLAATPWWNDKPEGYRKVARHWVVSPKKPETRAKRFAELLRDSKAGRTIKPLTRSSPAARPPAARSPATSAAGRRRAR